MHKINVSFTSNKKGQEAKLGTHTVLQWRFPNRKQCKEPKMVTFSSHVGLRNCLNQFFLFKEQCILLIIQINADRFRDKIKRKQRLVFSIQYERTFRLQNIIKSLEVSIVEYFSPQSPQAAPLPNYPAKESSKLCREPSDSLRCYFAMLKLILFRSSGNFIRNSSCYQIPPRPPSQNIFLRGDTPNTLCVSTPSYPPA